MKTLRDLKLVPLKLLKPDSHPLCFLDIVASAMQWTLMIFASIFLGLFLVTHALFNPLKHANTKLYRFQTTKMSLTNSFNLARIQDAFGIIPLCKEISKSTVVNDPTAGMTPEEQISYLSNVGGGMCGYPDWVRTTIGLGLNISLVTFAIFTLGYGE